MRQYWDCRKNEPYSLIPARNDWRTPAVSLLTTASRPVFPVASVPHYNKVRGAVAPLTLLVWYIPQPLFTGCWSFMPLDSDDGKPTIAQDGNTEHLANRDVVVVQEVVQRRDL